MLVLILVPVRCILKYISSNMRQQWAMQLIAIFRQWLLPANAAFLEGRTGKVMGPLGWGPVPWRPSRVTISVPRVREGLWDLLVCLDSPEIPWVLGCLMRVWSFLSPHSTAFPFPSPRPYLNVLLRKTKLMPTFSFLGTTRVTGNEGTLFYFPGFIPGICVKQMPREINLL